MASKQGKAEEKEVVCYDGGEGIINKNGYFDTLKFGNRMNIQRHDDDDDDWAVASHRFNSVNGFDDVYSSRARISPGRDDYN